MYNLTMFNTEEELCELTGLSSDNYCKALWEAGFDLDDWDVGFCSEEPLDYVCNEETKKDYEQDSQDCSGDTCYINFDDEHRVPTDDAHWLIEQMENYCVGYRHIEYDGKHYYLVYHA